MRIWSRDGDEYISQSEREDGRVGRRHAGWMDRLKAGRQAIVSAAINRYCVSRVVVRNGRWWSVKVVSGCGQLRWSMLESEDNVGFCNAIGLSC